MRGFRFIHTKAARKWLYKLEGQHRQYQASINTGYHQSLHPLSPITIDPQFTDSEFGSTAQLAQLDLSYQRHWQVNS